MTMTQKEVLVQRLSALLGFEDGAADVLEHLLSIESSDVRRQQGRLSMRQHCPLSVVVSSIGHSGLLVTTLGTN
jgi:hypothetical protein